MKNFVLFFLSFFAISANFAQTGLPPCIDTAQVLCKSGSDSLTLTAQSGLTNVMWYDSTSNTLIGTGSQIVIKGTHASLVDMYEAFYYTATDANGCPGTLCCPVRVRTIDCTFFDLALRKKLITSGSLFPGSTVTFEITVFNQGTRVATNVQVSDYIPTGLTLADANWSGSPATLNTLIPSIAIGDSVKRNITFTINSNFTGSSIRNWAEISGAVGGTDIDSDPDGTNFNQAGETNDLADDNIINQNGKTGGDEDDHDPAEIQVTQIFDLALKKTLSSVTPGPFTPGGTVTFDIKVYNQGTLPATTIQLVDYYPTSLVLGAGAWGVSSTGKATLTTAIPSLNPGDSITIPITFTISGSFMGSSIRNWAEIYTAVGGTDIDSDPDNTNFNSPGETDDLADDNVVNQNGKTGGDEDDHDPAEITVGQVFDLALKKTLSSVTPGPFSQGSTVTFDIKVYNQGTLNATNVQVSDYVPTGLTLTDGNWTNVGGIATLNSLIASIPAGDSAVRTITFAIASGYQGGTIRNWAEISAAVGGTDIDSDPDGTNFNQAGETNDLNDDNVVNQNGKAGGDEDDHDPAQITVQQTFDLALAKTLNPIPAGPFVPGGTVTFDIQVTNQGTLDATNVQIADYIPTGLTLADANWSGNPATLVTPIPSIPVGTSATRSITFTVNSNYQGATIRNWAEISAATNALSQADVDSDPDATNFNQTGETNDLLDDNVINQNGKTGGDEDDHDPAQINIQQTFDLALKKLLSTATPGPYVPGSNVTFDIKVFNQGTLDATNIQVVDYFPTSLTLASPTWTVSSVGKATLVTPIPTLSVGDSVIIPITFTISNTFMGSSIRNWAEINSANNALGLSDIDSDPDNINFNQTGETDDLADDNIINQNGKTGGDEDDHDPAEVTVTQTFDLALKKTLNPTTVSPIIAGGTVTFDIKIYNQGTLDATNIQISDYIPTGLTLSDANWSGNPATLNTPIAFLGAHDSTVRTITFTVNSNFQGTSIRNWAEISAAAGGTDIDSDPDGTNFNQPGETNDLTDDNVVDQNGKTGGDEDDHDPAQINIQQTFDLALRKTTVTTAPVKVGDQVTFRIAVFNQGTVDATNVVVTDYVNTTGYTFNPALNPGWSLSGTNVNYTIASLAAKDSTVLNIVLTVNPNVTNYANFINEAEVSSATNVENLADIDSDPDSNPNNDNNVQPGDPDDNVINENAKANPINDEDDNDVATVTVFDLALRKTVFTAGPYSYNQIIDFKITVYNQGTMPVQDIIVSDYVPSGYSYVGSTASLWNYNSISRVVTNTLYGPLYPRDSISFIISMQLLPNASDLNAYTNKSEITSAEDLNGTTQTGDYDSTPDTNPTNDNGGVPDSSTDDLITDNGTIDEDDHDPARIQVVDLALKKVLVTTPPHRYNQLLEFRITVYNQGNIPMSQVVINDYIPSGYTFATGAPNTGWTGAAPLVSYTYNGTLNPGDSTTVSIWLTTRSTTGGYSNWINYSEIASMLDLAGTDRSTQDVDSDPNGNTAGENAVTPGSPLDNNITDITKAGDQDDHDPAGPEMFDLALRKTVSTPGPYTYGDVVSFTIKVFNQGNVIAKDPVISDYVPLGFDFEASNGPAWSYNSLLRLASRTIPVTLKPGDSASVSISLRILPNGSSTDAYTNRAEITSAKDSTNVIRTTDADSRPDAITGNDNGGQAGGPTDDMINNNGTLDEDDEDPAMIPIIDLALRKKVSSAQPYSPGNNVTFTIYVYNQGNQTVRDVEVMDYIPVGYSFNPLYNPDWTAVAGGATTKIVGDIVPGGNTTVSIVLTVQNVVNGVTDYNNYAEIIKVLDTNNTDISNQDVDSNPASNNPIESSVQPGSPEDDNIASTNKGGEEDDHDVASVTFFDLALRKTIVTPGPYTYGQNVTFRICVYNQGLIPAHNIIVADKLPTGLEFVSGVNPGWSYNVGANDYHYTINSTINPMDSVCINITLRTKANAAGTRAYVNEAEILSALDDTNGFGSDFDSDPDEIFGNDNGGDPWGTTDNVINDNGTNDEDDHDPATVPFYDLALKKLLETPAPYYYGQELTFRVRVFNQGGLPATNVKIQDYIPTGFSFVSATSPFWTVNAQGAEYLLNGVLNPGDSVDFVITLRVDRTTNGAYKNWINYAEITAFEDLSGNDVSSLDVDSNPASNNPIENEVYPGDPEDNNITSTNKGGEEDDHDPAGIYIVDLALRKTVATPAPYTYGQIVDFKIKVFNQGNVTAQNVEITDYIPSGFEYVNSFGWVFDGVNKATKIIPTRLVPGDSIELTIQLKVLPNPSSASAYLNYAEVSVIKDSLGNVRTDVDSYSDNNKDNDGNVIDDEVNSPFDEDDHDPARIDVYDLALRKVLTTPEPYTYGQDLTYRIRVYNQGTLPVTNVVLNDYIPSGYVYDPAVNLEWSGAAPTITHIHAGQLNPGDSFEVNVILELIRTNGSYVNWANYSEIKSMADITGQIDVSNQDVDSDPNGDTAGERAVTPGSPLDNNVTDITKAGDQDDHDPAGPNIFDLAQRKTVVTAGPYTYGQDVDFRITVFNQGNVTAQNVLITDYIPSGFAFVSAYGWTFDGVNKATQTIASTIRPGDSTFLLIKLRVLPNLASSTAYTNISEISAATDTTNTPRVDIDSNPDTVVDNDGDPIDDSVTDPSDEDDHDPAMIEIFDLALRKSLITSSPFTFGQTHQYRIVVFNQGNVTAQNIAVNDYIPDGYSFVANNGWTGGPSLITTTIAGPLVPGDSVVLNLDLTFQAPSLPSTNKTWVNYSEIASAEDLTDATRDDIDSDAGSNGTNENSVFPNNPGDDNITSTTDTGVGSQDDHDPAGPSIFDLAQRKTVVTAGPYTYGQEVDFKITVFNQGNVPADNVLITDYIPSGFAYVSAYGWTFDGVNRATQTITNVIMPGDSAFLLIKLRVLPNPSSSTAYVNVAEISGATDTSNNPRVDVDSNPDGNPNNDGDPEDDAITDPDDEDDHDPSRIDVYDLALTKVLTTPEPYTYGQDLTYRIRVYNQGTLPVTNVVVNDYIPSGYVYNAGLNPLWAGVAPTITHIHAGQLNPGDSFDVNVVLQMVRTDGGYVNWANYSEIKSMADITGQIDVSNQDVDSDPNGDTAGERAVTPGSPLDNNVTDITKAGDQDDHDPAGPNVFDLAQRKTVVTAGPFTYGQEVDFKITVFNQGNVTAQNVLITDYIPSGFAYVSAYGWTFDGVNKATQTITSTIKPGDSSSLLIKLRVLPNPSSSTAYVNVAEISGATDTTNTPRVDIDSNPDGNPGNDGDPVDDEINDPNDEDDHDPSRIDVYDLALRKVVTTPPTYTYGQNLNFRIRVYNQGTLPVTNTVVEDYIPVGYTYQSSLNPLWTGAAPTVSYTHVPVLNPGDSFEINLVLQLSRTDGGATDWINYSEISSMRDVTGTTDVSAQDVDSDPNGDTAGEREVTPGSTNDDNITDITKAGDQDDHDPAGIEIYDLALRKQFKGTYPLRYGDIIAYEIKIFNQGNVNAQNIFVSDYIPQGYSFNPIENPNWVYDPITRIASTTFSNVVVAGDSAAVSINLTLEQFTGDRSAWKNIAEIETSEDTNGNPKVDIDSTPDKVVDNDGNPVDDAIHDPNDEDDHDPAEVEVLDIALRKWVPNEKPYYVPGEEVDFVISLHNQGNVVSSSIVVKDYLPNGFTFVAASNPGWTLVGSNLEYDYNTRLYPTDSVQLHLKLIVIIPASNVTLSSWENYAEIFSVRDTSGVLRSTDDADSFAGSDTPYERSVHDNDPYDEVIDGTGIVLLPNEDEDDHDPEAVVVTAYLGDKVWKDLDGDGVQDAGEMPLQGVLVTIYDCATGAVVQRDTTDINGNYGFEGLFGDKDYFVRFDASPLGMPNCAWTFKDRGGNDRTDSDVNASGVTDCTHLDWGERDSTVDAGFVELAAYGDYVWHDRDVDGQQEFGEEGIGGVTVTLYDAATNQIVRTGITDNNGYYFFDKLMPMQYYAKYTRPAGYGDTDFNIGSDVTDNDVDGSNGAGTNATTYLSPGETDRTWDYGVYKCSCISGEVWYDLNKDGIYQGIENGINGLSVYLVNAMTGAVVASTITGPKPGTPSDDGYYSFCSCLRPGMYYIRYDRPGDLAASAAFQGTDRTKDSHLTHAYGPNTSEKITVVSGSDIKDIHAGFQVKAVVGNYVWLDGNQNGLQDSGEKPVQGVKVAAYNTAGVMVSESTTGVDGKYLLDGIAAGDYYVKFVPSSQYGFTSANRGNDDIDSDVTGTQGLGTTQVMRLNTGDAIPHVDAGLILSVLPLEWLDFTAEYNGSFTELNWSTGAEINNSHFEIERRHESEKDFAKIGQESASTDASAALHEYSHDDYDVVKSGLYYYRIKQVDRDGKYSYSKIIAIKKLKANDLSIYIYPNPVRDLLKVEIDLSTDEDVIVDVIDANGKVVMHQPFGGRMKAGRSNELLNTEMLTSGNYVIRIKTSQTVVSKKFTVAK